MNMGPHLVVRVSPELAMQVADEPYWRDDGIRLRAAVRWDGRAQVTGTEADVTFTLEVAPFMDRLRFAWRVLRARNR